MLRFMKHLKKLTMINTNIFFLISYLINLFQSPAAEFWISSNLKINNYDTNKTSKMFINDFNWKSKDYNHKNGLISKFIGNIKNVNFDTKNISEFKETKTNEIHRQSVTFQN